MFCRAFRNAASVMIAVTLMAAIPVGSASAQGLLDFLFGNSRRYAPPPQPPPQVDGYVPFRDLFRAPPDRREALRESSGPRSAFCVRTCDGRYFPIQGHSHASAVQQCNALCPATEAQIFTGNNINYAVASNGRRYSDLANAFLYRKRFVPGCTCAGKSPAGLAKVAPADDQTLRRGDIVVSNSGFSLFSGRDRQRQAYFTPVDQARMSKGLRNHLTEMKVRKELRRVGETSEGRVSETTGAAPPEPTAPDDTAAAEAPPPLRGAPNS